MSTVNYAGFWLRFVAFVIDYIIVQVLQSFVVLPILGYLSIPFATGAFDFNDPSNEEIFDMAFAFFSAMSAAILLSYLIQILYYTIMEASKYQATLGKMALGLVVTDAEGKPLNLGQAFLRNLGKIVSSALFMIGYIIAGFTEKKQALHDLFVGALVVRK